MCQLVTALIVDDETPTRQILTKHIPWQELGVTKVYSAANGIEGLELAREWKPDIIISDIKMPFMNGIDMAKNVRDELPECRFAFLSAYADKEYLKTAIKLKATSFIEKPIDVEEVTSLVRDLVLECKKDSNKESIKFSDQEVITRLNNKKDKFLELLQHTKPEFTSNSRYFVAAFKFHVMLASVEYSCYEEVFENLFPKEFSIKGMGEEDVFYIIVKEIDGTSSFIEKLQVVLERILQHNSKAFLFASANKKSVEFDEIQEMCRSLASALSRCFFCGENRIYLLNESQKNHEVEDSFFSNFEGYLKERKKEEVMMLLHKLRVQFEKSDGTVVSYVKNIYYKLAFAIIHIAESQKISGEFGRGEIVHMISSAETLEQTALVIKNATLNFLEYASRALQESEDPLRRIEHYLQQNFYKVDININELARYFNFTPSYLCAMYKKHTGVTINQTITLLRVNKAKELLQSPSLKLYDVANEVGYLDGKYFTKVFTKSTGISPRQYRERYLQYENKR